MGEFVKFLSANFLRNLVNKATRGDNLLDLICTNDMSLFGGCEIESNAGFSDHSLVRVNIT